MAEKPVLSICIPTRDRSMYLEHTLREITDDITFQNTNKIEIVISDNCSDDDTENLCRKYQQKFPDKIIYKRQQENIKDKNFVEVLKLANGKYAKLNNDNIYFKKNALAEIVSLLENANDNIIFFTNRDLKNPKKSIINVNSFDELISQITYSCTWIGGLCVNTSKYKMIDSPIRFSDLCFGQIDILAKLMKDGSGLIIEKQLMEVITINKKGGYNIAQIFGENFISILQILKKEELLSNKTYEKTLKKLLLEHINHYYFDYKKQCNFTKDGYLKYLYKYYLIKPYFYFPYIKYHCRMFLRQIIRIQRVDNKKIITIFNCFKKTRTYRPIHHLSSNKFIHVVHPDTARFIEVGAYSYGSIDVLCHGIFPFKLKIGRFCSIGPDVKFILASDHYYNTLSTYPFKVMVLKTELKEAKSKGDIIVKDDVWIATNSIILSGVTIGQGAIVGAGSVVTKDVPPYAIVAGNPAKVIKYRFEPEIIEKLVKFDYSKLTEEKIKKLGLKLYRGINKDNVDSLLKEFEEV